MVSRRLVSPADRLEDCSLSPDGPQIFVERRYLGEFLDCRKLYESLDFVSSGGVSKLGIGDPHGDGTYFCCLLSAVCHLPSVVCRLLSAVHRLIEGRPGVAV
jgi:hypothetical protein